MQSLISLYSISTRIRQPRSRSTIFLLVLGILALFLLIGVPSETGAASLASASEIRGFVWHDWDQNGLWDAGEPALRDVLVSLADSKNTLVRYTHTDAEGEYVFSDLTAAKYTIAETDPAGFSSVTPNVVAVELAAQGVRQDFADVLILPGCTRGIDGRVWHDTNVDGDIGTLESKVGGMSVRLLDMDNKLCGLTISDSQGRYFLSNPPPGHYYAVLDTPTETPYSTIPLHWGIDLNSCHPAIINVGLQRRMEATRCCDPKQDIVGSENDALAPDGVLDDSLTVWLGTHPDEVYDIERVTVKATRDGTSRTWDTDPTTNAWVLGITDPALGTLLNPSISFRCAITESSRFRLFLSDSEGPPLLEAGTRVTVTMQAARQAPWQVAFDLADCEEPSGFVSMADPDDSVVSGTVWDIEPADAERPGEPQPLEGVKVTLLDTDGHIIEEQRTDTDGGYRFDGLKWNNYYLLQERLDEYDPVLSRYWGLAPTTRNHIIIDLENRPQAGAAPPPIFVPMLIVP